MPKTKQVTQPSANTSKSTDRRKDIQSKDTKTKNAELSSAGKAMGKLSATKRKKTQPKDYYKQLAKKRWDKVRKEKESSAATKTQDTEKAKAKSPKQAKRV